MTEKEFQSQILQALKLFGWRVHCERPAMNRRGKWSTPIQGDAGFPDIVATHEKKRRGLAIELKSDKGKATPAQLAWLDAFRAAGFAALIARPSDWDVILREVRA